MKVWNGGEKSSIIIATSHNNIININETILKFLAKAVYDLLPTLTKKNKVVQDQ